MRRLMQGMCTVVGTVGLLTMSANAAELDIEPRLTTGLSYYNLDLKGEVVVNNNAVNNVQFSDWLYFFGGGVTFSRDRFFLDLYGQYSFDGRDTLGLDVISGGIAINDLAQNVDFDRIETAATFGYRITDQFAGYVGYRYADADFKGDGSLGGIAADFSTEFKQRGPFVGAAYAIPKTVFDGAFVANAAVTFLDGDLANRLDVSAPLTDVAFDINGKAVGVNGGASWVTPLTGQLKLVLGADVSYYSFKDDNDQSDFDELIARMRAELRYNFDINSFLTN